MKGITPIISVILLIAIAASAAAVIAVWQGEFLSDYIGSLDEQSRLRLLCASASIGAESASFNCNSDCSEGVVHSLTATVHNGGESSLQLKNAFFLLNNGELLELPLEQTIAAGATRSVTAETQKSCSGLANNALDITIPTQCSGLAAKLPGESIQWVDCD